MKKSSYFPNNEESNVNDEPSILHITAGVSPQYIEFPEARHILWDRARTGASVLLKSNDIVPPLLLTHSVIKQLIQFFYDNTSNNVFESTIELASVDSLTQSDLSYRLIGLPKYVFQIKQSDLYNADSSELSLKVPIYVHDPSDMVLEFDQEITSNLIGNFSKSLTLGREFSFKSCLRLRAAATIRQNSSNPVLTMRFEVILPDQWFQLTPINPIGIFTSPLSIYVMGYIFGDPKSAPVASNPSLKQQYSSHKPLVGYLTLNQTRKVVLLLETDPAANTSPLVGLWIKIPPIPSASINKLASNRSSYQSNSIANHPLIWALCIRYLRYIITGMKIGTVKEAVFVNPTLMTFLLVIFTSDGKINFFEVTPYSESSSSSRNIRNEDENWVNDNGFMCMDFTVDLVNPESDDEASNPPLICKFHPLSRPESIFSFSESVRFAGVVGIGHDNNSNLYQTTTTTTTTQTKWLPPSPPPQDDVNKLAVAAAAVAVAVEEGEGGTEAESHIELPEHPMTSYREEEEPHDQRRMMQHQNSRQYSYQRIKETLDEGSRLVTLPVDPFSGGYPIAPSTSLLSKPPVPSLQSNDFYSRHDLETTPMPRVDVPIPLQTSSIPLSTWSTTNDRANDKNEEDWSYNQMQTDKYTPCKNCQDFPALLNEVYQLRQTVKDLISLIHHYGIPLPPPSSPRSTSTPTHTPHSPTQATTTTTATTSTPPTSFHSNHITPPPPSHYYQSHHDGSPTIESYSNSDMKQYDLNQNSQFSATVNNSIISHSNSDSADSPQLPPPPTTTTTTTTTSALNFFSSPTSSPTTDTILLNYNSSKEVEEVEEVRNGDSPLHDVQWNRSSSSKGGGSSILQGSQDRPPGSATSSPQHDDNKNREITMKMEMIIPEVLNNNNSNRNQLNDESNAPLTSRGISNEGHRLSYQMPEESTSISYNGCEAQARDSDLRRIEQTSSIRSGYGFVEEDISSMETLDSSLFRPMVAPVIPEDYFPLPFSNLRITTFNYDNNNNNHHQNYNHNNQTLHGSHTQYQPPSSPPPPYVSTTTSTSTPAAGPAGERDYAWDRRMDNNNNHTNAAAYANYVFDNNPVPVQASTPISMPSYSPMREGLSPPGLTTTTASSPSTSPALSFLPVTTIGKNATISNNGYDNREESESILAIQARYLDSE